MRPFIKKITSNVKSPRGDASEVTLGKHTLLLGANRTGKTSIIQGLELAATGVVDDVMGRDEVKRDKTLMCLAPTGSALQATADFTNGATSSYYKDPDASAQASRGQPCVAVHRLSRKVMSGSAAKLEEAILEWVDLRGLQVAAVTDLLPSDVHAKYLDIGDRMRPKADRGEGQVLTMIAEYAAKQQRKFSGELKALQTVQSAFADEVTEINDDEDVASKIINVVNQNTDPLTHLKKAASWAVDSGVDQCPTCGSQVGASHLKAASDHLSNQTTLAPDLEAVVEGVSRLMRDRIMWAQNVKYKRMFDEKQTQHDSYKKLKTSCLAAISMLVTTHMDQFLREVNRFLPDSWCVCYSREHDALGLSFDAGPLVTALSGAEWATLVTAVSCTAASVVDEDHAVLLVVEDRAWDSATLASVMRGFSKFDGQVIMQSTTKPKGRVPRGWEIVATGVASTERPAKQLKPLALSMLTSLGYSSGDIEVLSTESIQQIMEQGAARASVNIHEAGTWELA